MVPRRVLLASMTTALLLMAFGAVPPADAQVGGLLFPPDHFDGAGLWHSSGSTPVFDPLDPDIEFEEGAFALTTDGDRGDIVHTDEEGDVRTASGVVAWTKSPVLLFSSSAWDVRLEMTIDAGDDFPGAAGGQVVAEGHWTPAELYGMCTKSIPSSCQVYAVGPVYLTNDGLYTQPGTGVAVAGVLGSTFCTTGSQTGNIHHPCDGRALPCTDNDCQIVIGPIPGCVPDDQGDRVCVEHDDDSVCATGYQLTAPTDVILYEQACVERTPMGACIEVVGGMGTLSGFYGASGWACADAQTPFTCWNIHLGPWGGDLGACAIEPL